MIWYNICGCVYYTAFPGYWAAVLSNVALILPS